VLRRQTLELDDPELDVTATVLLVLDDPAGKFEVKDLTIRRGPTAPPMNEVLRQFRLQRLVEQFAILAVRDWTATEVTPDKWDMIGTAQVPGEDEEHWAARVYRMAIAAGSRPNKTVMDALGISSSSATQKVWLARKLGLLPKTEPGKARA
jgi:hypothetical protein